MFGLGGLDPKKMQGMMKQMGITQDDIPSSKVTIEKINGSKMLINNPSVVKMTIQGNDMFQIQGEVSEEEAGISEQDIKTVMEKTGATKEQAKQSLEKTHDLAEAILELS